MNADTQRQGELDALFRRMIDARDWDGMRQAVADGADPNADGGLAMTIAAAYDRISDMKFLRDHGGRYVGGEDGCLVMAVRHDAGGALEHILHTHADECADDIYPALGEAVRGGKTDFAAKLLTAPEDLDTGKPGEYLHVAAGNGDSDIVGLLLNAGVDVNAEDGSALWCAAAGDHVETVALLLDRGADADAGARNGVFFEAGENDAAGVVKLMLDKGCGHDVIDEAVEHAEANEAVDSLPALKEAQFAREADAAGRIRGRLRHMPGGRKLAGMKP